MSRPYHITAKDADLCRRAGVEQVVFTEYRLGPFAHRAAKLKHVRKVLIDMAYWAERIEFEAKGYRIESPADLAHAKRMELLALRGKWLLEAEDDALDALLVGVAVDELLGRLPI